MFIDCTKLGAKVRYEQHTSLKIDVDSFLCRELICGLSLLREKLDTSLKLRYRDLSVTLIMKKSGERYNRYVQENSKELKLECSEDTVNYVLYFFLRFFRDGYPEVDHIDLSFADDNAEEFDVVIMYAEQKSSLIHRVL